MIITAELAENSGAITLTIDNPSGADYSFGWVEGAGVTLVTDSGEYHGKTSMIKINRGSTQTLQVNIDSVSGTPAELVISGINKLNQGLPETFSGGDSISIELTVK
jgi:hypothetical protein